MSMRRLLASLFDPLSLSQPAPRLARWFARGIALALALGSVALLQVAAIVIFATQLWPRVGPRVPRTRQDAPGETRQGDTR